MVTSRVGCCVALVGSVAVVLSTAVASGAAPCQGQPPRAAPPAGPGNLRVNILQMPTPIQGQPYGVSLCTGQPVAAGAVSGPCRAADAAHTVAGATQNSVIQFKLQNGSFLPPGFHLDGFGVITGTSNADLSKVTVKICAFQLGGFGSNFNCQGQTVGFAGKNAVVLNTPPNAQAAAHGGAGPSVAKAVGAAGVGTVGTVAALKYFSNRSGPDCTSQQNAIDSAITSLTNAANALAGCGANQSCFNSRTAALTSATQSFVTAVGDYCSCQGTGFQYSAEEKAQLVSLFSQARISQSSFPSCLR